jgi:hypothetical protein
MATPAATLVSAMAAMAAPPTAPMAAPLRVRCSVVVMLAHPPTPSVAIVTAAKIHDLMAMSEVVVHPLVG